MGSLSIKLHPLVATAAVSAILVSLLGAAALLGWLPRTGSDATPIPAAAVIAANDKTAPPPDADAPAVTPRPARTANATPPYRPVRDALPQGGHAGAPAAPPAPRVAGMPPQAASTTPAVNRAPPVCEFCGKVENVRSVDLAAKPSGVGVVAGAVVGGLLGNQVGGGSGRTLATVAGAVGGGYAGNEIEKRTRKAVAYEVDVVMENRERLTFRYDTPPAWKPGDRVRVVDGALTSR